MVIQVKPVHTGIWNCMDDTYISIIASYDRNYRFMFCNSWCFKFLPCGNILNTLGKQLSNGIQSYLGKCFGTGIIKYSGKKPGNGLHTLGERLIVVEKNNEFFIEKYLGIKVKRYFGTPSLYLSTIDSELKAGRPVAIGIDLFCCPWSDFYRKIHRDHMCVVVGKTDSGDWLYCVDSTLMKTGVALSYNDFSAGCNVCKTFEIVADEMSDIRWQEVVMETVSPLQSGKDANAFDDMKKFANEFEESLNFSVEVKQYKGHEFDAPIFQNLLWTSWGRLKYADFLKYLANSNSIQELFPVIEELEKSGWEWQTIKTKLFKTYLEGSTKNLHKIAEKIYNLAEYEANIANRLLELTQETYLTRLKRDMENTDEIDPDGEIVFIDLSPYLNNKGFSRAMSNEAGSGFDANKYFYLAENLPLEKVWTINKMQFSFPDIFNNNNDNMFCNGQIIDVPAGRYRGIMVLASSERGSYSENICIYFEGGSQQEVPLQFSDWWEPQPFFKETIAWTGWCARQKENFVEPLESTVSIFAKATRINNDNNILKIQFPCLPYIHIFAISLIT